MTQQQEARQVVKYTFFKLDPAWRRENAEERRAQKREFAAVAEEFRDKLQLRPYNVVGLRGDCDFLLWTISPSMETVQELSTQLNRTRLAGWLTTPHSFLAMTRPSPYVGRHQHEGQEGRRATLHPVGTRYLFVYPFVKTAAWYRLPFDDRRRMMEEHFKVGHKFPSVRINTAYSFGLDDQEFVLSFEADNPADFLELVMALREAEQRPYTERDMPIFTCVAKPLAECLDALG